MKAIVASLLALVVVGVFLVLSRDSGSRREAARPRAVGNPAPTAPRSPVRSPEEIREDPAPARRAAAPRRATAEAAGGPKRGLRRWLGRVVHDDLPVRGARVLALAGTRLLGDAVTEEEGTFELSFPAQPEPVTLRVISRGYATFARVVANQGMAGSQHLGDVWIERGVPVSGLVVDPQDRPIRGAVVRIGPNRALLAADTEVGFEESVRTGADGRFVHPNAPPERAFLAAHAEGFGQRIQALAGGEGVVRVTLFPATTLRVAVRDPAGAALEGAQVRVMPARGSGTPREATTGADGSCLFESLEGDLWSVQVTAAGYRPAGRGDVSAEEEAVELVLRPWPCVEGRVLEPGGGPPPAGTTVRLLPNVGRGDLAGLGSSATPGLAVEPDGSFRICDLRPGDYRLLATAPGFAATTSPPYSVSLDGDLTAAPLRLEQGGALRLAVRSEGRPVTSAAAFAEVAPPLPGVAWVLDREGGVAADGRGEVLLENLVEGEVWVLVRAAGHVSTSAGPFRVSRGRTTGPVTVELVRGSAVEGRVLDDSGAPLAQALVRLRGPAEGLPVLHTDARGRYRSPPLPPGEYRVTATTVSGDERQETSPVTVELTPGEDRTLDLRFGDPTGPGDS